jgi:hypothetical protein
MLDPYRKEAVGRSAGDRRRVAAPGARDLGGNRAARGALRAARPGIDRDAVAFRATKFGFKHDAWPETDSHGVCQPDRDEGQGAILVPMRSVTRGHVDLVLRVEDVPLDRWAAGVVFTTRRVVRRFAGDRKGRNEKRTLGKSGLVVSEPGLGAMGMSHGSTRCGMTATVPFDSARLLLGYAVSGA